MKNQTEFSLTYIWGPDEIELVLVGLGTFSDPGQLYGPPEHCYPPEPAEAELREVYLNESRITPMLHASLRKELGEIVNKYFRQHEGELRSSFLQEPED